MGYEKKGFLLLSKDTVFSNYQSMHVTKHIECGKPTSVTWQLQHQYTYNNFEFQDIRVTVAIMLYENIKSVKPVIK